MLTVKSEDLFFIFKAEAKALNKEYSKKELYLIQKFFDNIDDDFFNGDLMNFLDNFIINNLSFIYKEEEPEEYNNLENSKNSIYFIKNEDDNLALVSY